jgi:hypothetical protein
MKKTIATFAALLASAFAALLVADEAPATRTVIPLAKAKKGCTFRVGASRQTVYYERAYVLAKKLTAPDVPAELWILYPDREPTRDTEGRNVALNVPAARVLFMSPKDGPVYVMQDGKTCRCPATLWGSSSGATAEH